LSNGAWATLGAVAAVAAAGLVRRGGANRRAPAIKAGDRVAYNPRYVERSPIGPQTKANLLAYRGTVIASSGALVNVRWDGVEDFQTYGYPNEVVLEAQAAKASAKPEYRLPRSDDDMVLADRGKTLLTRSLGPVPIKQIGKGMFSTIHRDLNDPSRVFAFVSEGAYEKEILADAHRSLPKNPHIPAVERFGTLTDGRMVYAMPFYVAPYRKDNAKASDHAAFNKIRACISKTYARPKQRPYQTTERMVECVEQAGVPDAILEAVQELRDASANYGDSFGMEFSPRNVATDADGNLVLLDLLYDKDLVLRKRQAKRGPRGW
jgi:hypothetical protein